MIGPSEFLLGDVRCFRGEQRTRLRPITLLVGENSTGKTTFLGCYSVLHRLLSETWVPSSRLDFNQEPFSMGSFHDIVRSQRGPDGRIEEFSFGFTISFDRRGSTDPLVIQVTFLEHGSQPVISSVSYKFGSTSFLLQRSADPSKTIFQSPQFKTEFDFILDEYWIIWLEHLSNKGEPYDRRPNNEKLIIDYFTGALSDYHKTDKRHKFFS